MIIISVYSKQAFKEYLLPSLNNADYSIVLEKDYFQIQSNVTVNLEVLDEQWKIKEGFYTVKKDKENYAGHTLLNHDVLTMKSSHNETISMIINERVSVFHAYEKYNIRNVERICIGNTPNNDIIFNYLKMVSKEHAIIERKGDSAYIINRSPNGTYVNSNRIDTETQLRFGDYINIMGLHMIFLGNILAIDSKDRQIGINENKLRLYTRMQDETVHMYEEQQGRSMGKLLFHRSPRDYKKMDESVIEIEEPPARQSTKQQPLFMTVGSSITMVIPMLLGSLLMVYASGTGGGSSLYMYSGLVMAVSSAAVGTAWTMMNINYQKKEEDAQNKLRFDTYSNYLVDKTNQIKERYDSNELILKNMYPSAEACLAYDERSDMLWNRNSTHKDFLTHRLGIGDIPFPIKINIPKEKFRMFEDELEKKPQFIKDNYQKLFQVPVTLDFMEHKLIGLVGGDGKKGAYQVAEVISTMLAANNCYTDVKLGYIYDGNSSIEKDVWNFAKWFPHVWSEDKRVRFMASDQEEASDVLYELTKVFRSRSEQQEEQVVKDDKIPKPYYVIFISNMELLAGELFSKYIFDKEGSYGLTTILLAEKRDELPNNCEFIIQNDEFYQGMYDIFDQEEEKLQIHFDSVDKRMLSNFSALISRLRVMEIESGGEIPSSLTFLDMFQVNRVEELPVKELWMKNRIYENIKGIIGQKAGGIPCYLDVHEKYHGPHGLVAGTTGSGKSELLQSYILSLAVNYSPDDIGFFLIDYKGGGMANLFNGLPHMIGQISNLSGNQVKRAMISIKSENRRRQRVFNENDVNNINAYTKLYKNGEADLPIPHLFIVIDEFAELKREEPEFMKELISVAQVGRSLGVHLILATQKPSGTVDDNIWSNSKFRLCLRVQDRQDSTDMLHKPDAAYITQAGRCYLQVGNDEIYELFQSGYSGASYDKNVENEKTDIAKMIALNGKVEMTGSMAKSSKKKKLQYSWLMQLSESLKDAIKEKNLSLQECVEERDAMDLLVDAMYEQLYNRGTEYVNSPYNSVRLINFIHLYAKAEKVKPENIEKQILKLSVKQQIKLPETKEYSQLEAVKDYLAKVAQENHYRQQQELWLPVLSDKIYLDSFSEYTETCFENGSWKEVSDEWSLEFVLGQIDDPANQAQVSMLINLAEEGHIAVCGSVVSGKSTMLQTMMYAVIQKYTPAAVNIYGLDFSSKLMSAFESAPHIGGIMYEDDLERIRKFFHMLQEILNERKKLFKGGNYSQYVKVHGITVPAIIIFVDNYSAFKEKTEEAYEEIMIQISKEGVGNGIFLVVTGAGFGMNDITNRLAENITKVLCLALPDKYVYGDFLHSMQFDIMPESGIKGRGLVSYDKRILEYQTALAVEAENDYQRMELIRNQCETMQQAWKGAPARKVPEIPEKPTWSQFKELDDFKKVCASTEFLPIGYDVDNAGIYGIPLREIYCYLIMGGKKTGKTNLMKVGIQSALQKKAKVCLIDSPAKGLNKYKEMENISYIMGSEEIFVFLITLKEIFIERNRKKNKLVQEGLDEELVFEQMAQDIPYFIFIADLSNFILLIYQMQEGTSDFVENIIEKGMLHNIYFIAELPLGRVDEVVGYKTYELFIDYRMGLHLGGRVADNPVLTFDYLSYKEQEDSEKTGIAQVPGGRAYKGTRKLVIPDARK